MARANPHIFGTLMVRRLGIGLCLCCLGLGAVAIECLAAPQVVTEYTSSSE